MTHPVGGVLPPTIALVFLLVLDPDIASYPWGCSSPASPFLVVIGIRSEFNGTTVDFVGGLPELIFAKFLLPARCVGKRDQVARPLVQLGQRRPRLGALDIPADLPKHPLHSGLVADFTIDMSMFAHR